MRIEIFITLHCICIMQILFTHTLCSILKICHTVPLKLHFHTIMTKLDKPFSSQVCIHPQVLDDSGVHLYKNVVYKNVLIIVK